MLPPRKDGYEEPQNHDRDPLGWKKPIITDVVSVLIILLLLMAMLCGCGSSDTEVTTMKSPVILIGKHASGASVTLIDGDGYVRTFSNSGFATNIWYSREVGDTIK